MDLLLYLVATTISKEILLVSGKNVKIYIEKNSNLSLNCNHSINEPSMIRWIYEKTTLLEITNNNRMYYGICSEERYHGIYPSGNV